MRIKRIEHVGIVVRDLEAGRHLWEDCLGVRLASIEDLEGQPIRVALYPIGASTVELIAGTTPESKHARMAAEGRGGLHHICLEVENIEEAMAELRAKGVPFVDDAPRPGHQGSRIAFIDPTATENCLIELAEIPR